MFVLMFVFLIIFVSLYCEVLVGSMGIFIPITSLSVFYFAIHRGWIAGMFIGLIAGTTLDLLYGRTLLLSSFTMMFVAGISIFWLHKGEPESVLLHFLPGAFVAFITTFPLLIINSFQYGSFVQNLLNLIFCTVAGAILLPVMIPLFDSLAKKVELPLYSGAKSRALERR
jgi:hypothetical protein